MTKDRSKRLADPGKLIEAALDYSRQDIRVFPIHGISAGRCTCGRAGCRDAGKHPITPHGFKDATTDEARIRRWWRAHPEANIGAVPGPAFVVFDVDPRNGGFESLQKISMALGGLPATQVAETGLYNGVRGQHIWLRVPPGLEIPRAKNLAQGIELKCDRGYVVMPPSLHVSGVRYRWLEP